MNNPIRILIVEDLPTDAELCEREVKQALPQSVFRCVETEDEFLAALETFVPDLILSDYSMPRFDGMTALTLAREHAPETPFIIVTGSTNEETAVACMKAGAWDYVIKEHMRRLGSAVSAALEQKQVRRERRMATEALHESEAIHRLLLDTVPVGIFHYDRELRITYCNDLFVKIIQSSRNILVGLDMKTLKDQSILPALQRVMTGEQGTYEGPYAATTSTATGWTYLITAPVRDAAGDIQGGVAMFLDITEKKRTERELEVERNKLHDILDAMEDGVFIVNEDYHIEYINPAIERQLGPVNGRNCYEYFHDRTSVCPWCKLPEVIQGRSVRWNLYISKTNCHYDLFSTPIANNVGGYSKLEIMHDVTDRIMAHEAKYQAEAKFAHLFENAVEGIFQSTPEGRFIMANPALAKILGYDSPEELVVSVTDVSRQIYVYSEDREKMKEAIARENTLRDYEVEVHRKDGSVIWVSVNFHTVRNADGAILYYEGTMEDVTKRKHAEAALRTSFERLRKTVGAAIRTLAATVESRDPYTAGHQRHVAELARTIAQEMSLEADRIEGLRMAAVIHDIGKIGVPAELLSKPTKLLQLERALIENHVQTAYDILKDMEFPWPLADIVYQHHERLDGTGYPRGIKGDEISLEGRILAVADVVEAMSSHRPYRPGLGIDAALAEIAKNSGILYDPEAVDVCLRLFREKGFEFAKA